MEDANRTRSLARDAVARREAKRQHTMRARGPFVERRCRHVAILADLPKGCVYIVEAAHFPGTQSGHAHGAERRGPAAAAGAAVGSRVVSARQAFTGLADLQAAGVRACIPCRAAARGVSSSAVRRRRSVDQQVLHGLVVDLQSREPDLVGSTGSSVVDVAFDHADGRGRREIQAAAAATAAGAARGLGQPEELGDGEVLNALLALAAVAR
mmetsp:Transcript_78303/g.254305  ORF Transcript_78303/g.254305 Transcript_78303/m.254305 type:complete len:211 (-) Transcript_78303:1832-2464(-)